MPVIFGVKQAARKAYSDGRRSGDGARGDGSIFGDRLRRRQPGSSLSDGALASVFPTSAGEVELLAGISDRYSLPLMALGAETTPEQRTREGRVLIRFDLMRGLWPSDTEEPVAEAEPGALWLELDNDLRVRGWGLTVYPTSAPRPTIGGWLALDGVGVGSFEYGRQSGRSTADSQRTSATVGAEVDEVIRHGPRVTAGSPRDKDHTPVRYGMLLSVHADQPRTRDAYDEHVYLVVDVFLDAFFRLETNQVGVEVSAPF